MKNGTTEPSVVDKRGTSIQENKYYVYYYMQIYFILTMNRNFLDIIFLGIKDSFIPALIITRREHFVRFN